MLTYLYCLLPAHADVQAAGLPGMEEGRPPRLLPVGNMQAAISEVGDDFSEAKLNASIRDLDWLSPRAVRHHEVVDGLYVQCKQLLPLTFGAIFLSEESLRQRLTTQAPQLEAMLARLRGKEQWELKLSRDQAVFEAGLRGHSEELRHLEAELRDKPPGTAFMLRKKLQNLEAREIQRVAAEVRDAVHQALSACAVEARRDQLTTPAEPGNLRLDLRSAYLVNEADAVGLKDASERLFERYESLGYSLELTGPWPAFSFVAGLREALA